MQKGTIVKIDCRGFGFIAPDGSSRDVFFHAKSLAPSLVFGEDLIGSRVEFKTEETERGIRASFVRGAA